MNNKTILVNRVKQYPHFVIRKVHNGYIKFDNQLWEPREATDRLNGMRFAFGVYAEGVYTHPIRRLDLLCLWGSEESYKALDEKAYREARDREYPLLSPDGYLRQYWWHPIGSRKGGLK